MEAKIRVKTVILYALISVTIILVINFYFFPAKHIDNTRILKQIDNVIASQNIAPQRLYISVWRNTKNEYVDKTMNGQNWNRWRNKYLKHIKTMEDANIAINTMLISLNDSYSKFLLTDKYLKQKEIIDSKITGIGIMLNKTDDNITVENVLENSPAQKNNILPGDKVLTVNGQEATKVSIDEILTSSKDKNNEDIEIKIQRDNQIIEKKIKKEQIPIKTMEYKITKDNIGIITLATIMGEEAIDDFIKIILATNETKGLIIDLRDNYGGVLSNAIEMANYMLDDEEILSINGNRNNKLEIFASNENIFKEKKVVILTNKNTASAAEILAGTLKDNIDAVIIGENTFGKNTIQQIIPMPNNTGLIITTYKYILPSGEDIHNTGIRPNIYYKENRILNKKLHKDLMMEEAVKIINGLVKNPA